MHSIIVRTADRDYEVKTFKFPGGELQVEVVDFPKVLDDHVIVIARVQSSDDLVQLALVRQVISQTTNVTTKGLVLPYFPYARQDRTMQKNQAFSLQTITDVINNLEFDQVTILDPHSDVTPALVDNVEVIEQQDIIVRHEQLVGMMRFGNPIIVSPDAGAVKKATKVAWMFQNLDQIVASKVRNTTTGEISHTEINNAHKIPGRHIVIVDDICDGGRTFIELAKVIREYNPRSISLYVTHGIFSKGLGVFDGIIDNIFTTDSFQSEHLDSKDVPLFVQKLDFNNVGDLA